MGLLITMGSFMGYIGATFFGLSAGGMGLFRYVWLCYHMVLVYI